MDYKELFDRAEKARENAYAPFSKFKVGAALLTKSGKVYIGVNVENSSFGATICAERTAFVKAVSEGEREFSAIAIASSDGGAWPCGICRQFMREFCDDDFLIITGESPEKLTTHTMEEILPVGFRMNEGGKQI